MAKFDIPDYSSIYDSAYKDLQDYYARILQETQGDVEKAKRRLMEDYQQGKRITLEDYAIQTGRARETAQAEYAQEDLTVPQEQRALLGNLLSRGVSQGGLAETKQQELKSRQELRREAIDRALRRSEEDAGYAKERGLETLTKEQRRGTEDVASDWRKFQTEKQQEREEKAAGMAESRYSREFGAKQAKYQMQINQEAADRAKEQWDWTKKQAEKYA